VNPQLTIFALAMRCAGFVDEELEKLAGRQAGGRESSSDLR